MCFVSPARVVRLTPGGAEVEREGARFEISLLFLEDAVAVGDWVAVQAQRHAVARLSDDEAAELLRLYAEITRHLEGTPA
ncbi:MAG: HypC/HybG/HupF family hydrogenase formation chaperone [Burkholderiaceae bacterium]|nr:HypC/HybG/HupF family hydrogenase formation chaperone [Burkholderiaceae bacterium]